MKDFIQTSERKGNQLGDVLLTLHPDSKFPPSALVDATADQVREYIESVSLSKGFLVQDPSVKRSLSQSDVAVYSITVSEFSKTIQSCVVPNAAGSPVDILRAQDNIQVLRRMGKHNKSVLIVVVNDKTSPIELKFLDQFFATRKIKDLVMDQVQFIFTGRLDLITSNIKSLDARPFKIGCTQNNRRPNSGP